ncbi:hypothetical protein BGZ91_008172 [Linnemannia elongata]|nr:hypothetical protein BGZ91_008172 [Linnemannia elongata]KAG0065627.1 hypothetical protein BGZ90_001708 [Linnemannia elongata]
MSTATGQAGEAAATTAATSSLPGMMMMGPNDPSMQLFNPSEQRYFSEFLDTLVVDQDFTFDPSAIPNLPNLPLFSQDVVMPGGFNMDVNAPFRMPSLPGGVPQQQQQVPQLSSQQTPMDYDMSNPTAFNDKQQASVYTQHPISVPAKRSKTNKGGASTSSSSRPSSLDAHVSVQDPTGTRIATPIQQLSKLSLNQSAAAAAVAAVTTSSTKAKKNKREEDDPAGSSNNSQRSPTSRSQPYNSQQSTHQQRRQQKEGSRDRNTSMSDEDAGGASDSTAAPKASTSASADAGAPAAITPKRKPYKELLTEEEKRANHIASEQKRRNTIRNGFKDMTDIIPDLKDVNSSKSTILFKAVDFIKHLERRNRILQEKATLLESRLLMQKGGGHTQIQSQAQAHQQQQHHHSQAHPQQQLSSPYRTSPYDHSAHQQSQHQPQHIQQHHHQQQHSHFNQQLHRNQQQQQQQQQHQQPSYHSSGLDDKRLQEIPNIYPVSMNR